VVTSMTREEKRNIAACLCLYFDIECVVGRYAILITRRIGSLVNDRDYGIYER